MAQNLLRKPWVQQNSGIHPQCFCNSLDVPNAQVAPLAFNARDVGSIQVAEIRQRLLGQILAFANLPHVVGKQAQQLVQVRCGQPRVVRNAAPARNQPSR